MDFTRLRETGEKAQGDSNDYFVISFRSKEKVYGWDRRVEKESGQSAERLLSRIKSGFINLLGQMK